MSFKQSILIPLELFKKCNIEDKINSDTAHSNSDITKNIKIADHNRIVTKYQQLNEKEPSVPDRLTISEILDNIPDKSKPYAHSILLFISKYPDIINWDKYGHISLDNRLIPNSDISKILLYYTNNLVITQSQDIPIGSHELYKKMRTLNLPKEWVPNKSVQPTRRLSRRRKRSSSTTISWSPY